MMPTTKMLGDAGEHYALSRFTFAGRPATKMPDGWKGYDLAVEGGAGLLRVSIKTRSETEGWKASKWFSFDDRRICEWLVLLFVSNDGPIRSWIIPWDVVLQHANTPGPKRKDKHLRDVLWSKLVKPPLSEFENNWDLKRP